MSAYSAQKKNLDASHKELTGELTSAQASLKREGADQSAEKISEIQVPVRTILYILLEAYSPV